MIHLARSHPWTLGFCAGWLLALVLVPSAVIVCVLIVLALFVALAAHVVMR